MDTAIATQNFWDTEDQDPYPFYEGIRDLGDVVWEPKMRAWLVVSAKAIKTVLMDDTLFAQPYTSMQAGEGYRAIRLNNPRSFQFLTGEKHREMHRWWLLDLLSAKWVAQFRPAVIAPVVKQALDGIEGREVVELADDFAERIPIGVFAGLMDLPHKDWASLAPLKKANDDIGAFASAANSLKLESNPSEETKAIQQGAVAAAESLNEFLRPLVRARQDGKGDDFVSRIWAGGPKIFPDWNEVDTLDACRRLLFAGSDTTTHAIANGFYMLLTDPELRAKVNPAQPESVGRFVDEVLRMHGTVHFRPRRATADTELAGVQIAANDMVLVVLQAANRDPEQFGCPHMPDLARPNGRSHLAFNFGPRACPGANLARAELFEAIQQGLTRFPAMKLAEGMAKPHMHGMLMRSYRPLHVLLNG